MILVQKRFQPLWRLVVSSFVLLLFVVGSAGDILPNAPDWNAAVIPASLNRDRAIKLVGGYAQVLTLALQASEAIRKQETNHDIHLEWDFPRGMSDAGSAGVLEQVGFESRGEGSRVYLSYQFKVDNNDLLGRPGDRLTSEWSNQSFFVNTPVDVSDEDAYVSLSLRHNQKVYSWRWPLQLVKLTPAKAHPKMTTIGLWDYGLSRAGIASDGIAAFFHDVGINFIQKGDGGKFSEAIKKRDILVGGYTHHSAFSSKVSVDMSVDGKLLSGTYPCPQAILASSAKGNIPGVDQLTKNALQNNGIATIDYEPTGLTGFCDDAINEFENQFKIKKEEFDNFRDLFASKKLNAFRSNDKKFTELYRKWVIFNSQQTSAYVKILRDKLKENSPRLRLALSSGKSYGTESISTLRSGNDNSLLAAKVDIAMPQLYFGYDGAGVKLLMQYTKGWRETMISQGAQAKLWPLLLIRYSGARVHNSSLRVRQQILGALASGAQGVILYNPANMDASYWTMLAETMKDIDSYEGFYQEGHPVSELFSLRGMPDSKAEQQVSTSDSVAVEATESAFTAHEKKGKYLLTLFNLREQGDLEFDVVSSEEVDLLQMEGVTSKGNLKWVVPAGGIGFITLAGRNN